MFAIVQVGSAQYKISEGDTIDAHLIDEEAGKSVQLDKVLLFADGETVKIGQPYLKDVAVSAKVVKHVLADKVIAYKYRRRKDSHTTRGHRQKLTSLNITKISSTK